MARSVVCLMNSGQTSRKKSSKIEWPSYSPMFLLRLIRLRRLRSPLLPRGKAFSLLVHTEQPIPTRLFLKKSCTSPHSPVQSRSENALGWRSFEIHHYDSSVGLKA